MGALGYGTSLLQIRVAKDALGVYRVYFREDPRSNSGGCSGLLILDIFFVGRILGLACDA